MLAEILSSRESNVYHAHYSNALGKCGVAIIARCLTGKEIPDCSGCISAADMQEAAAHFGGGDRERFLTSRMLLRAALSRVSGDQVEANFWRFARGASCKPRISEGSKHLNFNVAHARNVVAVALNVHGLIGVDIESLDALGEEAPSEDLIRLTPSAAERDWINALLLPSGPLHT